MKSFLTHEQDLKSYSLEILSKYCNFESFELDINGEKTIALSLEKVKGIFVFSKNIEEIEGLHNINSQSNFKFTLDSFELDLKGFYFSSFDLKNFITLKIKNINLQGKTSHEVFVYTD